MLNLVSPKPFPKISKPFHAPVPRNKDKYLPLYLVNKSNGESTKIGHFLILESILEVKNQLNVSENDFLFKKLN